MEQDSELAFQKANYYGGAGDDCLWSEIGDDRMYTEDANDDLGRGAGDDTLYGGIGKDILRGDYGSDTFIFQSYNDSSLSTEVDTIMDFETGRDKIELRYMGFDRDSLHNGELAIEHHGNSTYASYHEEFYIKLDGFVWLSDNDFIFS